MTGIKEFFRKMFSGFRRKESQEREQSVAPMHERSSKMDPRTEIGVIVQDVADWTKKKIENLKQEEQKTKEDAERLHKATQEFHQSALSILQRQANELELG